MSSPILKKLLFGSWSAGAGGGVDNYFVSEGTKHVDLTVSNWQTGWSAGTVTNDTSVTFGDGANSTKIVTAAGTATLKTVGAYSFGNGADPYMYYLVIYIEDVTKLKDLFVYLNDDSNYAEYFQGRMLSLSDSQLTNGWNIIPIMSEFTLPASSEVDFYFRAIGASPFTDWLQTLTEVRVIITPEAGEVATVYLDSIWEIGKSRPKVILTTDDSVDMNTASEYTFTDIDSGTTGIVGNKSIEQFADVYGYKMTHFYQENEIDTANYLTTADLEGSLANGHDVGYHHATSFSADNQAAAEAKLQTWLDHANALTGISDVTMGSYPNGWHSPVTHAALAAKGFKQFRDIIKVPNILDQGVQSFYNLHGYAIDALSSAQTLEIVDYAISTGQTVILYCHNNGDTGLSNVNMAAIFNGLEASKRAGTVDIVSLKEWYAGL